MVGGEFKDDIDIGLLHIILATGQYRRRNNPKYG